MSWAERDDYEEDGLELAHGAAFWAFCALQYACLTAVLPPPTTADRHMLRAISAHPDHASLPYRGHSSL